MKLRLFLPVFFLLLSASLVSAQDKGAFTGKWVGPWKNSLGQAGNGNLILTETPDGKVSGTWTGTKLTGKRINKNIVEFHCKEEQRAYRMLATIDGDTLTFLYVCASKDPKEGGTYSGEHTLKRAR